MTPPVFLYQWDQPYPNSYKWDKLDWKILSADDIDDFDKVSEFFGHDLKTFYELYIDNTYAEKCDIFLDACKQQGFTGFLSIVIYCTYGLRRLTRGTHYIVACKETDEKKLSNYLELITDKNPVLDNIEPIKCYVLENYRNTKHASLRRFFNDLVNDSDARLEILLSGYLPRPSNLSEQVIKRNLSVARNAKHLEIFIALRLNEDMTKTDYPYFSETIEETCNVLITKLSYLTNATPPHKVKEVQQALSNQLRLFNEAFCFYLRSSDYTDEMLTKLNALIKTVTSAVKALDYGMKDDTWCIVSGVPLTNNITNDTTSSLVVSSSTGGLCKVSNKAAYEAKFVAKKENETTTILWKKSHLARCRSNVKVAKPSSRTLPIRLFHSAVPRLTVLIIGRSQANNTIIIDRIIRACKSGASRIPIAENEWIVNYVEYVIKYVNIVLNDMPIDWSSYPVIHGLIFVIENKVPHLSFIVEKNLRNLLGMIPRNYAKNCCIVNCFLPTSLFSMADASEQLSRFVTAFCENHGLMADEIKHIWVYKSSNVLTTVNTSIEEFLLRNAESPVTINAIKVAACLAELGEVLDQKPRNSNVERLMASIIDRTMTDAALYFRERSTTASPLTNDEWKTTLEWDIDEDVLDVLREINTYLKQDEATGLGKVKSTSMFAMKNGSGSTLPQRSKKALTSSMSSVARLATANNIVCNVNLTAKEQNERIVRYQQKSEFNQCEINVKVAKLGLAPPAAIKTVQYNVVFLGSSASNKQILLNNIHCVQQHENFNTAAKTADVINFGESDEYVVDYGTHSIRYISKNELSIEQFDIHGLMIVIENGTLELSNTADNQIRDALSRLPRRAVNNCCIVNTFTPSESFDLNAAEQQMRELTTKFRDQHALTDAPSFVCIDTMAMQAILEHKVSDNANLCQNIYESSQRSIETFLQAVRIKDSIWPADLKTADKWKRLCEVFRPHVRNRNPETLRLMASIAENSLTGLAIYCRKNRGDAQPLCPDDWPAAVAYWNSKDEHVGAVLQMLYYFVVWMK